MTNIVALFELTFDDTGTTKVCLKLEQKAFSTQMQQMMERLLASLLRSRQFEDRRHSILVSTR
ncbi:hypothetical protein KXD40_007802 [Peronospora effusa]|uniref:Uncharacterized protein n=1 Tax=Peronospora effusa TaxID=542832 RepID=A0A425C2Q1_9STRA|nr:hypothetical protein DD237_000771 [Peronospora effusa]UIZ23444.1 hypothetical protein KXD40_007802 [Peronospora effusa]